VAPDFAEQNLYTMRATGQCLAFGYRDGTDLTISGGESWASLSARLPTGWQPDFLVLNLAYQTIPPAFWSAPVPLIALATDWNFTFHSLRHQLPYCDAVFTDTNGVEVLRRLGCERVFPANLFGLEKAPLEAAPLADDRDIDVVFVGNFQPAVQRERMAWLGRVASLADRWRVVVATAMFGEEYHALLRRSRIVFNRSVRGECNRRAFEGAAAGALVFNERGNSEVEALFGDRKECIFYSDDDLEGLLEHFLTHEDERRAIAEAGRQKALDRPYAFFWNEVLERIESCWPQLVAQVSRRPKPHGVEALLARIEQKLNSVDHADQTLCAELSLAVEANPQDARLQNALGVLSAIGKQTQGGVSAALAEQAARHFRQAVGAEATNPLFALNLIEALAGIEETKPAIEGARLTLALLNRGVSWSLEQLDGPHFPLAYDLFRLEWERAAWDNAGRPRQEVRDKCNLLRWRLHALLADLTGDLVHFHEAAVARPDLPTCRAALGCALARTGRFAEAAGHLRYACEANPFDRIAARACFQALTDSGDLLGAKDFSRMQRLLHAAALLVVPPEWWFVSDERARNEEAPSSINNARVPRVSLCMIVKNEERNLPACLASVADLVDEVIVVDTGSTDKTKEIAAGLGVKVFDFAWVDSFSAARNESLRHATGQWIFWMDADDRLDPDNREKLRTLFASLKPSNIAYSMKCLCLPDPETGTATVVDHIRLFPNYPLNRWEHRVHEQILPAIRRAGGEIRWCDVVIHHAGYQNPGLRRRKLERDIRLLELEHAELGDHPFTLFNLGSVYQELGRYGLALTFLRRSLELSSPSDSIVRKLYALIVNCHRVQQHIGDALAACQDGRRLFPNDAELLFAEALLRRDQNDLQGAASCLSELLQLEPDSHFASVDAGLRGYKAHHNLGVIYRQLGKLAEAESEWRTVVTERPDFLPAWQALAELYLTKQRWAELEEVVTRLESGPHARIEAAVLRGRAELARGDFAIARRRLEEVIAAHPQALWPRVILSHVLLKEGRDLAAAANALNEILRLDPEHAEARNNLAVLMRDRERLAAKAALGSGPL
jgi:tetratricopeptide (TPR) repeat protein